MEDSNQTIGWEAYDNDYWVTQQSIELKTTKLLLYGLSPTPCTERLHSQVRLTFLHMHQPSTCSSSTTPNSIKHSRLWMSRPPYLLVRFLLSWQRTSYPNTQSQWIQLSDTTDPSYANYPSYLSSNHGKQDHGRQVRGEQYPNKISYPNSRDANKKDTKR